MFLVFPLFNLCTHRRKHVAFVSEISADKIIDCLIAYNVVYIAFVFLPETVDSIFRLLFCRKIKVVAVENDVVTKLQVQSVCSATLVGYHDLGITTETFEIFKTLFRFDAPREFRERKSFVFQRLDDVVNFIIVFRKDYRFIIPDFVFQRSL